MGKRLEGIVAEYIPEDVLSINKKLVISITHQKVFSKSVKSQDKSNFLKDDFKTKEDLLKGLCASCYVPIFSAGFFADPPVVDGEVRYQ